MTTTNASRAAGTRRGRARHAFRQCLACLAGLVLACGGAAAATYTATWTQVSTSNSPGAPAWRGWSAMTWVGTEGRIVMWGGSGAVFMNDVVGLDPASAGWTAYEPSTNCPGNTMWSPPNGSDENGVVHDPINDELWLYNGGSGYRCATTAAVGRTAGAGTTSTSIVDPTLPSTVNDYYKDWTVRATNGTKVRVNAYNAATKTLTLSAAIPVSSGVAYDLYVDFGDGTWSYSFVTGQYDKLGQRHWGYNGYVPPARKSPGFAGDATRAFLFGGADFDNGLYKLDFATRAYTVAIPQGLSSSPAARGQIPHQFVYDSVHDRYVLFGGRCFDPGRCSYQNMLDDTWVYNANTNAWTQVNAAVRPPARNQGQMYFDAGNGVVVLYGGMGNGGVLLNDLWTFDVATLAWTQQTMPPTNPGGIYLGQAAYAPTTGCGFVVYGLRAGATVANGTWRLCLAPSGGGNTPPIASFTTTPSTAAVGASIAMSAAGSSDPGGSIVGYAWNFGDGTTGSGVSVSKAYASAGTKTVTLTVTDNGGLTASTTRNVTIVAANVPPVANFTASPSPTTVGTPIAFSAAASSDPDGTIASYAWNFGDGTTATGVAPSKAYAAAGTYTVTLTVTDNGGLTGTTTGSVTVTGGTGTTTVWFEDALPAGAAVGGSEPFTWVAANPAPYAGALAHQSTIAVGAKLHGFVNATATLPVGTGDVLYTYVYLDPANPPEELLVQWNDGNWEHRAYWGANLIALPAKAGSPGNRYMGPLPPTGQWVRLEVPAALLALEGRVVSGMSFSVYDGRATWDQAGKIGGAPPANQPPVASFTTAPSTAVVGATFTLNGAGSSDPDGTIAQYAWSFGDGTTGSGVTATKAYAAAGTYTVTLTVTDNGGLTAATTRMVTVTPAGPTTTTVWVEDALPTGAIAGGSEPFTWVASPTPFSGTLAHQSGNTSGTHQHYFVGARVTLPVNTGDKLFAYVYLDPANPPREVMLQFYDGTWEHRAFWGANLIPWGGSGNSNSGRYMGPLPAAGQWVRLEVPAAQVGLEGRTLTGMAFALYDGRATWDQAGKVAP